jgi:hypothetical protein
VPCTLARLQVVRGQLFPSGLPVKAPSPTSNTVFSQGETKGSIVALPLTGASRLDVLSPKLTHSPRVFPLTSDVRLEG